MRKKSRDKLEKFEKTRLVIGYDVGFCEKHGFLT